MGLLRRVVAMVVMAMVVMVESTAMGRVEFLQKLQQKDDENCESPALFVFGASYMDIGENFAAMPFRTPADFEPYGMDYFGKPTGRHSNGRLIIDHISEGLGQGILSPYLGTVGTNFQHGVVFASSGSKACNSSIKGDGSNSNGLFSLAIQIDQFRVFKSQALSMYHSKKRDVRGLLPSAEAFSSGVYIIETGNNDYGGLDLDQYVNMTLSVLKEIEKAIQVLYNEGARTFVVTDAFPAPCYPSHLWREDPKNLDENGCIGPALKAYQGYNLALAVFIKNLNAKLEGANLILFSLHDIIMDGIVNPSKYGLKYTHRACCGYGGGDYNWDLHSQVFCGQPGVKDGKLVTATVCSNRSEYLMWDGTHPTQEFAFHIAQAFLNGKFMTPSYQIKHVCRGPKQ